MTISTITELLKEYVDISGLSTKEQKLYYLIRRYEQKVSKRLQNTTILLREKGIQANTIDNERFRSKPHPFLELLLKEDAPRGFYCYLPS